MLVLKVFGLFALNGVTAAVSYQQTDSILYSVLSTTGVTLVGIVCVGTSKQAVSLRERDQIQEVLHDKDSRH